MKNGMFLCAAMVVQPKKLFGKDHPLCTQHHEERWEKNRRAALETKELH
jgi:hypothetical protein